MTNHNLLEDAEPFTHCTHCIDPDGCITRCKINEYLDEDIAQIRGEE